MKDNGEALVAAGYDAVYRSVAGAPALWEIWREHAAGIEFPSEFSHISFVTLAELRLVADALRLDDHATLVDLACGMSGPSLWMARQGASELIGIDASPVAIEASAARADRLGLGARSTFRVGTFTRTGLTDRSADAVVSFDALQYAPDKDAACREMARVLEPGKRLAFTAFEVVAERVAGLPALGDDPVADYAPLLERTGFDIESYEETPGWEERLTGAYQAIIDGEPVLQDQMGADAYAALALEVSITLERRPYRRRVLAIATRR